MLQYNANHNIESIRDRYRSYLSMNNKRFTRERDEILTVVMSIEGHFSQKQLYDFLKERIPNINRTTIYRNLPDLEKCNILRRVQTGDASWHYEHTSGHTHHDHLLCMSCGDIIEVQSEEMEKIQNEICVKYDFLEIKHQLCIQGICGNCQRR